MSEVLDEVVEAPVESVSEAPEEVEAKNPLSMSNEEFEAYEASLEAPIEVESDDVDVEPVTETNVEPFQEDAPETATQEAPNEDAATDTVEFSKESAYDEIMSEFKANGKMISVSSVDEVRKLMQMGANYQKKMSGMKKDSKFIKMLENNELLDESKLNYLIDLSKHDKGAISQLLKDSQVDPLDVDVSEDSVYKPNTYTINDAQVQLDDVLSSLQETDSYATTIDIIGNKWDKTSAEALAASPNDIVVLNDQVASGIYDKITTVVEKERMLGNLEGVTDFDAYRMVGRAMHEKGMLNTQSNTQQVVTPPAKKEDPTTNEKRRAAAPTRSTPPTKKAVVTKNPLAMSNEEFEAAFGSEF